MRFALLGNPNSGKTTLFNELTGANAHVGNWPGVTVEKKTGIYKKGSEDVEIIDLPGIYSLSPYTPEEIISRNYLINEKPDLVINIVDASNLERNLYLTTQILEVEVPVVIALNMMDLVEKDGHKIDIKRLEKILGVKIVPIVAFKKTGLEELINTCILEANVKRKAYSVLTDTPLKEMINVVEKKLNGIDNSLYHAIKIVEQDEIELQSYQEINEDIVKLRAEYPDEIFDQDFGGIVADLRYRFISKHINTIFSKNKKSTGISKSDKIDKVLTHRIWGIPIFIGVMFLVFHLTFSESLFWIPLPIDSAIFGEGTLVSPGVILFNLVDFASSWFGEQLGIWLEEAPMWVSGLLVDGLWGGLSSVLSFIPQILCLFFFITLLEDSGYMARVAFIMDRAFRKFGLSGKAFVPLLMCFGCAVPGIMATRTLENAKERKLTIMLTPFFSCGAKLPIWAVFAGIMYQGAYADLVVFSIYLIGIIVSIVVAIILSNTTMKGEVSPFVMELPAYHFPRGKNIGRNLWTKLRGYIVRAGTIIAGSLVVIWFFSSFGWFEGNFGYLPEMVDYEIVGKTSIDFSMLAFVSKGLSYVFYPLGFAQGPTGYLFVIAAFTGLIAKEMVPATLGSFVGMAEEEVLGGESLIGTPLEGFIGTIAIAAQWSFLVFNLLVIPCMAAVAAARKELGNKKDFWLTIAFWFVVAYVVSFMFYIGITYFYLGIIFIVLVVGIVSFLLIKSYKDRKKKESLISSV